MIAEAIAWFLISVFGGVAGFAFGAALFIMFEKFHNDGGK